VNATIEVIANMLLEKIYNAVVQSFYTNNQPGAEIGFLTL
jgi:hypothetical protein